MELPMVGTASRVLVLGSCSVMVWLTGGCTDPLAAPPRSVEDDRPAREAEPTAYVHSAERCAECHGDIAEAWTGSAHAHATTSPLFAALRAPDDASCARCHAPVAGLFPEASH